jgi:hypothetical protein
MTKPSTPLFIALCLTLLFCHSCGGLSSSLPEWLARPDSLEGLLSETGKLGDLALAAGEGKVLLAGGRRSEGGAQELFAVRAELDGTIESRWLLSELEPGAELIDIEVGAVGDRPDAFSIVAAFEKPGGGDSAFYWPIPASGAPAEPVELNLEPAGEKGIAVRDLHLFSHQGADFLLYSIDSFTAAAEAGAAMVLLKIGTEPIILGRYSVAMIWEITKARSSPAGIAVARSWREGEIFSTDFSLFDDAGKRLAGPQILFTAKYLFSTDFIWDAARGEWTLLWGTSHRYWYQRLVPGGGELRRLILPAREIRFDATVSTFLQAEKGCSIVLEDGKRLLSVMLDVNGDRAGDRRELIGIGETGNRRLHVLDSAWSGGHLALLVSFGGEFHYRLVEP